jgi:hypothetical protein
MLAIISHVIINTIVTIIMDFFDTLNKVTPYCVIIN